MPQFFCDADGCPKPAGFWVQGACEICNLRLCHVHFAQPFHPCPTYDNDYDAWIDGIHRAEKQEVSRMLERVNVREVEKRASSLRQGIKCAVALDEDGVTPRRWDGSRNSNLRLVFEDGEEWMIRMPRFSTAAPPPLINDFALCSEAETCNWLQAHGVAAPRFYDFKSSTDPDNQVGTSYAMMQAIAGTPRHRVIEADDTQGNLRVIEQLADVYIRLSQLPRQNLGSLHTSSAKVNGPVADVDLVDMNAEGELQTLGPFDSLETYFCAVIKRYLGLVITRELHNDHAVDMYLIYLAMLPISQAICNDSVFRALEDGKFYLRHVDDKGDHIMVDSGYSITGIIDWEGAMFVPKPMAFTLPAWLWDLDSFFCSGNGSYEVGCDNKPSQEEVFAQFLEKRDQPDLAACVRNGHRINHLKFALGIFLDPRDWSEALSLFATLRDSVGLDVGLRFDEWKSLALQRWASDEGLQNVLEMET